MPVNPLARDSQTGLDGFWTRFWKAVAGRKRTVVSAVAGQSTVQMRQQ